MDFFCESLRLQLIRKLPELVEIDTRPESEGMGDSLRRGIAPGCGCLADPGANCSIDRFLKRNPKLPRALFQQSREIIIERQGRSHCRIIDASSLMSRHHASPRFEIAILSAPEDADDPVMSSVVLRRR
jgi:hypothetical protein